MVDNSNSTKDFSRFAGELAESMSFNKSIGQIYGLLYISPEPLSLEDIAKRLSMSKGNASINLRILESWGAVKPTSIHGSRRDYYEANHNIKEVVARRFKEGLLRRLDHAEEVLNRLMTEMDARPKADQNPFMKQKVSDLQSLLSKGRKALSILPKIVGFLG